MWIISGVCGAHLRHKAIENRAGLLHPHQGAIAAIQASDLMRIRVVRVRVRDATIEGEERSRAAWALKPACARIVIVLTVLVDRLRETVVAVAVVLSVWCCASSRRP